MNGKELVRRMKGLVEYETKVHPSDEYADLAWSKLGGENNKVGAYDSDEPLGKRVRMRC